jgi:hypothetical protein
MDTFSIPLRPWRCGVENMKRAGLLQRFDLLDVAINALNFRQIGKNTAAPSNLVAFHYSG